MVELRGRIILIGPGLAAVHGDVGAPVVALDHALRVVGRDPHVVVVAVGRPDGGPGLAGVGRLVEADVEDVDGVLGLRVGVDAGVVEGALAEFAAVA